MTLRARLHLMLVVLAVVLAVVGGLALQGLDRRQRAAVELRELIEPARVAAARLQLALVGQLVGLRTYALTGQREGLDEFEDGLRAEAVASSTMRRLLSGRPGLVHAIDAFDRHAAEWRAGSVRTVVEGTGGDALGGATALSTGPSKEMFDRLRGSSRAITERLDAAASASAITAQQADADFRRLTYGVIALCAGIIGGIILLFHRWVTVPLGRVGAAVRLVAGGGFDVEVPRVGPPDMARIGADVDRMRRRILLAGDEGLRARQALGQFGVAVAAIGAELAPSAEPLPDSVELAARLSPAEGVLAGDWYDAVELDGGSIGLAVVDVSGHGALPAIYALRSKQLLLAGLRLGYEPGEALDFVAGEIGDTGEVYLTGCVLVLDPATGVCLYANAGHPPGFVVTATGLECLEATGSVLGPLPGSWTTSSVKCSPGDLIVLSTDGVLESRDVRREEFGQQRLVESVTRVRDEPVGVIVDAVFDDLIRHAGRPDDDVTLVVCRIGP